MASSTYSISSSPAQTSTGVTLHKHISNFVDIEAPKDKIWIGCASKYPEEKTAFLLFYILDGKKTWEFHYRRALKDSQCEEDEREYKNLIKSAKTVRFVGIQPIEENGPQPKDREIPGRFTKVKKRTFSTFIRLQAGDKCKAFFEHHCDLPQNYWGGTTPE
ncbi:MAG: hypothetical protein KF799_06655 [Bdellovibrionales bacterium]|nr:hypothetical protein [Bdellovibrionales bacterium]